MLIVGQQRGLREHLRLCYYNYKKCYGILDIMIDALFNGTFLWNEREEKGLRVKI